MQRNLTKRRSSISIEVRPADVYPLFRNQQYTSYQAIAEYVDNSVQSFIDNKEKLKKIGIDVVKVNISFGKDPIGEYILIEDNAGGIPDDRIDEAFRIMKPRVGAGLNEFGLGMKVASIWFGSYFSVETSALGEPYQTKIIFDVNNIMENDSEKLSGKNYQVRKARKNEHFTKIKIRKINSRGDVSRLPKGGAVAKITDHISDIHSEFIKNKQLELTIQKKRVKYLTRKTLKKEYWENKKGPSTTDKFLWKKHFRFDLSGDYEYAEGYIGILPKFSSTKAGLLIFRRGRVVHGSGSDVDERYRPNKLFGPSQERKFKILYGRIIVGPNSPVSANKSLILEPGSPIEDEFLEKLKEVSKGNPNQFLKTYKDFEPSEINNILPLERMANSYRVTKDNSPSEKTKKKKAKEATDTTGGIIEEKFPKEAEDIIKNPDSAIEEKIDSSQAVLSEKNISINVSDSKWDVTYSVIEEPKKKWFVYEKKENKNEVHVRLNLSHPFTTNFIDKQGNLITAFLRIAAALSLAEIICEQQKTKSASALRHTFNRIMDGSLSKR